jgi:hypothetical protein
LVASTAALGYERTCRRSKLRSAYPPTSDIIGGIRVERRIEDFAFTKGEPKPYESSPGFVRLSCGECGSALGTQAKDDPKLADFSLGCLDDPNAIRPEFHMFTSTQVSWCEVADGLPRHAEGAPELEKLWSELDGWTAVE